MLLTTVRTTYHIELRSDSIHGHNLQHCNQQKTLQTFLYCFELINLKPQITVHVREVTIVSGQAKFPQCQANSLLVPEIRVISKSSFHYVQSSHLPTVFDKGFCHITVRGVHRVSPSGFDINAFICCIVLYLPDAASTTSFTRFYCTKLVICGVMAQWQINHQVKTKGKMSTKLIRFIGWFCKI